MSTVDPGTRIADRYVVERELGAGGMGAVYLAQDEKFRASIALKIAAPYRSHFDEFKERFAREARIGNLLGKKPGFVRAFDWGELPDKRLYLAMDLVPDAKPLDLKTGTLGEKLRRLRRAAELVAEAHAQKVVHRDVKPQNFLQAADGTLWLSDFGLAKLAAEKDPDESQNSLTALGVGMGTPWYMPPEQFESARTVDERADVYALGVMLFQALTGGVPFPKEIPLNHRVVREGKEPAPSARKADPSVPAALDDLCSLAIALDVAKRLASARDLVAGLERWLSDTSSAANAVTAVVPPSSTAESPTKPEPPGLAAQETKPDPLAQVGDVKVGDVKVSDVKVGDAKVGDVEVGDVEVGDVEVGESGAPPAAKSAGSRVRRAAAIVGAGVVLVVTVSFAGVAHARSARNAEVLSTLARFEKDDRPPSREEQGDRVFTELWGTPTAAPLEAGEADWRPCDGRWRLEVRRGRASARDCVRAARRELERGHRDHALAWARVAASRDARALSLLGENDSALLDALRSR